MNPKQLSEELSRRRTISGLSMLGGSMGQIVTLYQTGIVGHLPDPPIPIFDAAKPLPKPLIFQFMRNFIHLSLDLLFLSYMRIFII